MLRSRLLFTILLCGSFFAVFPQSADSLFIMAAHAKLNGARAYTLGIAELMPAESYAFRPSADQMTFGEQLLHLSANLGWLSSHYLNNKAPNPVKSGDMKLTQKDSIIRVVDNTYQYALQALNAFPRDQLGDTVPFFAGPMRVMQIINLVNDHQSHHRGQLIVYLRLKGIKPPPYVGW